MRKSARVPLVMNILVPEITHSSPSRTAVVRAAEMSLPASGSVMAAPMMASPVVSGGRYRRFCSSVP